MSSLALRCDGRRGLAPALPDAADGPFSALCPQYIPRESRGTPPIRSSARRRARVATMGDEWGEGLKEPGVGSIMEAVGGGACCPASIPARWICMGSLPFPRRRLRRPIAFTRLAALLALATAAARADAPTPTRRRAEVPWTTSRFAGTPEAPLPYVAEPAFPGLTFDRPLFLAQVPGSRHLVVAEQGGRVVAFPEERGADRAEVVVDLSRGRPGFGSLYGLAFHPRFDGEPAGLPLLYAQGDASPTARACRGSRRAGPIPPTIDPESEEIVITWLAGGHNGGCLAFGPDGLLYISTGDAGARLAPRPARDGAGPRRPALLDPADRRRSTRPGPALPASLATTRSSRSPAHGPRSGPMAFAIPGG